MDELVGGDQNYVDNELQKGAVGPKAPHTERQPDSGFVQETPAAGFGPDYDYGK